MTFANSWLMILVILFFGRKGYATLMDPGCLPAERNMAINGRNAMRAPWMAYIIYNEEFICGGSLVSDHLVLTAEHCAPSDVWNLIVRLGEYDTSIETDGQTIDFRVKEIFTAPHRQDMALLKLTPKVSYSETIKPICIVRTDFFEQLPVQNSFTLTGWGRTSRVDMRPAKVLQQIFVYRMNSTLCNSEKGEFCCVNPNQNTCGGDSGSPLVAFVKYNETTTIPVQYGLLAHNSEYCFDHAYYVDVNKHVFWILIANWA